MIGLGGWGGRNERHGPYVYFDDDGKLVRDTAKGPGGHHGPQHAFQIIVRDVEHPITKGMPRGVDARARTSCTIGSAARPKTCTSWPPPTPTRPRAAPGGTSR